MMIRSIAATAAAVACVLASAPAGAQSAPKADDPKPAASPAAKPADPVVARVNGSDILQSDVLSAREQLPEQYRNLPMERLYQPLLTQLIRTRLLSTAARAQNLQDSEDYKQRLELISDRLLEEAFLRKLIAERVTEDALRARYKEVAAKFPTKEEIRARHILVKSEAEAADIIKELAGGADFAKLAAEKSIGPSKSRGGDLGFFGRGQMVKAFEDAAFALADGAVTQKAVQTQFGFHVIRLEERRQSKPPTFEEARDNLGEEMSQEIAQKLVDELTGAAKIERFELDGSSQQIRRIQPAPPQ